MTIGGALAGKDNALNLIRFTLAAAVIYAHSFPLADYGPEPAVGSANLGSVAVGGFFALSGYLIAGSRMRLPFFTYLWHRALRIFPGFWVCLVVVAFVIAPLASLAFGQAWVLGSAFTYVVGNSLLYLRQLGIDGTLADSPYPSNWNGPLWTLVYEFLAYIGAGILLSFGIARRHSIISTGALLGAITVAQLVRLPIFGVTNEFIVHALWMSGFFAAGMFMWALSTKLPASPWVAGGCAGAVVAISLLGDFKLLAPAFFAYVLLWLGGFVKTRLFTNDDISYGVYIYAWPVQQVLVLAGAASVMAPAALSALVLALTIPLAWASWRLVEKPAMSLKGWKPFLAEVAPTR